MSELDRKLLDGIRLTSDAYVAGQLAALRELRELLDNALSRPTGLLATAHDPVEKTKARGAKEAIEHVILNLEKRIDTLESTRDT